MEHRWRENKTVLYWSDRAPIQHCHLEWQCCIGAMWRVKTVKKDRSYVSSGAGLGAEHRRGIGVEHRRGIGVEHRREIGGTTGVARPEGLVFDTPAPETPQY